MPEQEGEALTGLAADLDRDRVHALLLARAPSILEEGHEDAALLDEHIRSVASEVCSIVGANPKPGPLRDLALTALAFGVAADIEFSLFPEQQLGDEARGRELRRSYERFLKRLEAVGADQGDNTALPVSGPQGTFPPAPAFPDPAVRTCW